MSDLADDFDGGDLIKALDDELEHVNLDLAADDDKWQHADADVEDLGSSTVGSVSRSQITSALFGSSAGGAPEAGTRAHAAASRAQGAAGVPAQVMRACTARSLFGARGTGGARTTVGF